MARTLLACRPVMRGSALADVDTNAQNVTAETIRAALMPKIKAIVAPLPCRGPFDMGAIFELPLQHRLLLIG